VGFIVRLSLYHPTPVLSCRIYTYTVSNGSTCMFINDLYLHLFKSIVFVQNHDLAVPFRGKQVVFFFSVILRWKANSWWWNQHVTTVACVMHVFIFCFQRYGVPDRFIIQSSHLGIPEHAQLIRRLLSADRGRPHHNCLSRDRRSRTGKPHKRFPFYLI